MHETNKKKKMPLQAELTGIWCAHMLPCPAPASENIIKANRSLNELRRHIK